jgi:hypothetical protein
MEAWAVWRSPWKAIRSSLQVLRNSDGSFAGGLDDAWAGLLVRVTA